MATFKKILESLNLSEEKPKNAGPGDTWQTKSGNWVGMKQGKKGEKNPTQSYGQEGKKKAKAYASGGDPDKVDGGEKDEPEKDEPEKEQDNEVSVKIEKGTDGAREKIAKDIKSGKLSKENGEKVNKLLGEIEKMKGMSGDQQTEFAQKLMKDYGVSTNSKTSSKRKFYIRSLGSDYKAMGENTSTDALVSVFDNIKGFGEDDGIKTQKNALQGASKPELATASEPGDENVDKIFGADSVFLSKLAPKYKGVFGPKGKDGKILHPSSEHSKEYFQQSVDENTAIKNTIAELRKQESPPSNMTPKMADAVEAHQKRMEEMKDVFDTIKDPKERASKVGSSYATLFQEMHKADPDVGGSMIKNMAEMSLYDTEIAGEKEAYLPSAGTFPSGDKLRVDRDGKGQVERVASVSVKYGKSGQFYGFPGQTDKYEKFHPEANNPKSDFYERHSNRAGRVGHTTGVNDKLIDDPKKFQKMIDDSGMGETIKDPKKLQDITKRMKDTMVELKKKYGMPPEKESWKTLQKIQKESEVANKELMKELDDAVDWEALEKMQGSGDMRLCKNPKFGVLALTNMISFMGVVKTGGGLPGLEHNHQEIHDGKYVSKTEKGSDNPKAWNFGYRPFGQRAGGLIAGYNGDEAPPQEEGEEIPEIMSDPQDEPETKKEQYESLEGTISRIKR